MTIGYQMLMLKQFQNIPKVSPINQSDHGHRSDKKFTLIFTTMNSLCSLYLQGREGGLKNHLLGLLQTAALLTRRIQLLNKVWRLKGIKCGRPIRCGTFVARREPSDNE